MFVIKYILYLFVRVCILHMILMYLFLDGDGCFCVCVCVCTCVCGLNPGQELPVCRLQIPAHSLHNRPGCPGRPLSLQRHTEQMSHAERGMSRV